MAPSEIIAGSGFDTLEWDLDLTPTNENPTITWESSVTGLQPGQSQAVTLGSTVTFTQQGVTSTLSLPPTDVVGQQVLSLDPASQTVTPGQTGSYELMVDNPTSSAVTYEPRRPGTAGRVGQPAIFGDRSGRWRERRHAGADLRPFRHAWPVWVRRHRLGDGHFRLG